MLKHTHPIEQEELMAYLDGELPAIPAATAAAHLENCRECQELAADLQSVTRRMIAWQVDPSDLVMRADIAEALNERADTLKVTLANEMGAPIGTAREAEATAGLTQFFAAHAEKVQFEETRSGAFRPSVIDRLPVGGLQRAERGGRARGPLSIGRGRGARQIVEAGQGRQRVLPMRIPGQLPEGGAHPRDLCVVRDLEAFHKQLTLVRRLHRPQIVEDRRSDGRNLGRRFA